MNRLLRAAIIIVGLLLIGAIAYFFIIRPIFGNPLSNLATTKNTEEVPELTEYQIIANSPYQKLLMLGINDQSAYDTPQLYITDFDDNTTANMDDKIAAIYSNYVPATDNWFTNYENNLYRHSYDKAEILSQTPFPIVRSTTEVRNGLAASPDASQLAWSTRVDSHQEIVLYDSATISAQLIFGAEENTNYHSLTWAPNSQELAMINSNNEVIMIDRNGVQNYNPISFAFSELNYLEWIEEDTLAVVVTSRVDNPNPFTPKIVLFNRRGDMIEEHALASNIGVPRVLWSDDALRYTYYNPWKNHFVVYNRFDEIQHVIPVQASGSFAPFGWTTGITPTVIANNDVSDFELNFDTIFSTAENNGFDVTADEWEGLNLIHKDLMNQFKVDESTYRFNVDSSGTILSFTVKEKQKRPEQIFLQVLLQSLYLLEDVPAINLEVTLPDETVLRHNNFTRETAQALTEQFTAIEFANMFVITTDELLGNPAHKTDVPEYTHLGDILYSSTGEFNPYPAMAFIGTELNENEKMVWRDNYSLVYPMHWLERNLGESAPDTFSNGDTLFYTSDTEFRSNTAWEGFGISIRQFNVPAEITVQQWVEVNRSDRTTEALLFEVHSPLEGMHIITEDATTDEYILKGTDKVYSINYSNSEALSESDEDALQRMIETFSDHSVFQRGQ